MTYDTNFRQYRWICNIVNPQNGHRQGMIVGKQDDKFAVRFSDGTIELFTANEIFFD